KGTTGRQHSLRSQNLAVIWCGGHSTWSGRTCRGGSGRCPTSMKARCSTPLSRKRTRVMSRRRRAGDNKIGRPPPSPARSVGHRSVRKTIVVFCEGTTTEPAYIGALKKDPDVRDLAAVDIRIETADCGAVPLTLVQRACELRAKAIAENAEIDEIWCIF